MGLKIIVGIPTVGRASILSETLAELCRQTRLADEVIVCGAKSADLEGCTGFTGLFAGPGLARQRNAIIDRVDGNSVVVFFDDDFLAAPTYLAAVERHLAGHPTTMMVTGTVLADGINGPGLTPDAGRSILASRGMPGSGAERVFNGYGCNMAVRVAALREHGLRFDERLPLYGWQEDVDLSCRLAKFGEVVKLGDAYGVHLGVKSGRGSGVRLGYSQVANPLYLSSKGDGYPLKRALSHLARNILMNAARSPWAEAYVDRRGRLKGNMLAIRDLLARKMAPERILEL